MTDRLVEQTDEFNVESLLKKDIDFKTMSNIEFMSDEENIKLLKKMCISLNNRICELERKEKLRGPRG